MQFPSGSCAQKKLNLVPPKHIFIYNLFQGAVLYFCTILQDISETSFCPVLSFLCVDEKKVKSYPKPYNILDVFVLNIFVSNHYDH